MKAFPTFLVLAMALRGRAQSNPVSEYSALQSLCISGGIDSYVGVMYNSGLLVTYNYGQCYPYTLPDGDVAAMAVFCKSAVCSSHPNPNCTGGNFPPLSLPVPAGTTLINVADFVAVTGEGAICNKFAI